MKCLCRGHIETDRDNYYLCGLATRSWLVALLWFSWRRILTWMRIASWPVQLTGRWQTWLRVDVKYVQQINMYSSCAQASNTQYSIAPCTAHIRTIWGWNNSSCSKRKIKKKVMVFGCSPMDGWSVTRKQICKMACVCRILSDMNNKCCKVTGKGHPVS